jgi:hypothetical protein
MSFYVSMVVKLGVVFNVLDSFEQEVTAYTIGLNMVDVGQIYLPTDDYGGL